MSFYLYKYTNVYLYKSPKRGGSLTFREMSKKKLIVFLIFIPFVSFQLSSIKSMFLDIFKCL